MRLFCDWLFFRDGLISQKFFILSRFSYEGSIWDSTCLWEEGMDFLILIKGQWQFEVAPSFSSNIVIFHIFRNYCCRKPWIFEQRLRLWDSVWMQGVCKGVLQDSGRNAFAPFRIEVSMKQEFWWAERFRVDERNGFTFRICWVWNLIFCREW